MEILLLRKTGLEWEALTKPSRRLRPGYRILFPGFEGVRRLLPRNWLIPGEDGFYCATAMRSFYLPGGHIPLPPYIERSDEAVDAERYQTVSAKTQRLSRCTHRRPALYHPAFEEIRGPGVEIAHCGTACRLGHFPPGYLLDIRSIKCTANFIRSVRDSFTSIRPGKGGRITAVGTTVVRTLETIYDIKPGLSAGQERPTALSTQVMKSRPLTG